MKCYILLVALFTTFTMQTYGDFSNKNKQGAEKKNPDRFHQESPKNHWLTRLLCCPCLCMLGVNPCRPVPSNEKKRKMIKKAIAKKTMKLAKNELDDCVAMEIQPKDYVAEAITPEITSE